MRLLTKNATDTETLVINLARAQHEYEQKKVRRLEDRKTFRAADDVSLQDKIQEVREKYDSDFYYSSQMVFPWAAHFVDTATAKTPLDQPKFFLVTGVDAAHINGPAGGMYFLLVAVDANRNTVALAWAHFADNENDATWDSFMGWVKTHLPKLNDPAVTVMRDGKKSISKALRTHLPDAFRFYCVRHAGEAAQITVSGGQSIQSAYTQLALALTASAQSHIKNSTPQRLIDYLNDAEIPEAQRLLAQFSILGGHTDATFSDRRGNSVGATLEPRHTTAFVESNNGAALRDGSRGMDPVSMTLQVAITWTTRMMKHKAEADGCTAAVPPQVEKLLDDLKRRAEAGFANQTCTVTQLPGPTVCAHVRPRTDLGNVQFLCNLTTKTCACGFYELTWFPCIEMAMLARARGRLDWLVDQLLHEQDKTPHWQAQYKFDFAACMVSSADVWLTAPSSRLELPGGMPRRAGRPKEARIRSPLERQRVRAAGADVQPRKSYKCKKCGQPKKGHTCSVASG
jgi:hypothetical protein